MAKMNRGVKGISAGRKVASAGDNESSVGTLKPGSPQTSSKPQVDGKTDTVPLITHKQIEERAKEIWRQKGCPAGQDEKIWLEAESQLKQEPGIG